MIFGTPVQYGEELAKGYRQSDEVIIGTGARRHFAEVLEGITRSFERPISVLDIGCGTGRFFHCLRNVQSLLGVDASPYMLAEARTPVRAEAIDAKQIELQCADIQEVDLTGRRFDFIYSIGVLGEFVPMTPRLCRKLLAALSPEGRLFFTVVDTHSRLDHDKCGPRVIRAVAGRVFRHAPNWLRQGMNQCVSSLQMTKAQLQKCLAEAGADAYEISRYEHPPRSGWQGAHYECLLRSRPASDSDPPRLPLDVPSPDQHG